LSHRIKAPAKINLNLHITGKRGDGYHRLESIITFADLADELEVENADNFSLEIRGPFSKGLDTKNNLVLRAAKILKNNYKVDKAAKLVLTKNIPVGAGLGGGSADAAATISLLCELWDIEISDKDKYAIGISLGADIPVCQLGKPALVSGVGEQLSEINNFPEFYIVLVNPRVHVSTERVFKMGFNKYKNEIGDLPVDRSLWHKFLKKLDNDLESNAIKQVPEIRNILDSLEKNQDRIISRMSGSGATCFALFDNFDKAESCAEQIKKNHPDWWVVPSKLLSS
jgi:4-diphosphocytidyl-2-C-methyl-D-erythritol kinase